MNIKELPLQGKTVLVRVDFNVPLTKEGHISDDTRIQASLETIRYLLLQNAKVILISHLGRPKGYEQALSLKPCAKRLSELLGQEVKMAKDCIGEEVEKLAQNLHPKEVLLLENLRFHQAEEEPEKDLSFAKKLASLAQFYVNDAFASCHRAHSSITELPKYFPRAKAAGFLLEKEIEFLGKSFAEVKHPFYTIVGGAKISSKLGILQSLLPKVDALFIGGAMAYTFLKVKGISIGDSLYEEDLCEKAKDFLEEAERKKVSLYFPEDFAVAKKFSNEADKKIVSLSEGIPVGWQGMDIGPKTCLKWKELLQKAKMVFWNGPLGVFEFLNFAKGTFTIAKILSNLHAITIVGGGDSVAAINVVGLSQKFSHISTGGGATLEYVEHGHLPGLDALIEE